MLLQSLRATAELIDFDLFSHDIYFDATIVGLEVLELLRQQDYRLSQEADFLLRYQSKELPEEQSVYCRYTLLQPRSLLGPDQWNLFDPGYDLEAFYTAARSKGYTTLPAVAAAYFPWETLPYLEGEPQLIHLGMQPIPDGGGGQQVLSFSRKRSGEASLISLPWHQSIAAYLSSKSMWLMGA